MEPRASFGTVCICIWVLEHLNTQLRHSVNRTRNKGVGRGWWAEPRGEGRRLSLFSGSVTHAAWACWCQEGPAHLSSVLAQAQGSVSLGKSSCGLIRSFLNLTLNPFYNQLGGKIILPKVHFINSFSFCSIFHSGG